LVSEYATVVVWNTVIGGEIDDDVDDDSYQTTMS